jgi:uncharacterized protein YceK
MLAVTLVLYLVVLVLLVVVFVFSGGAKVETRHCPSHSNAERVRAQTRQVSNQKMYGTW